MGGSCCILRDERKRGRPPDYNPTIPRSFRHHVKPSSSTYKFENVQTIEVPTEINGKWQIPQSPRKLLETPRQKKSLDLDIRSRSESYGEESTTYSTSSDSE